MKKISIKVHVWVANIIMCIGGVVVLVDMFNHGGQARKWVIGVGMLFVIAGFVYRMLTVRCPYCGDALTGRYTLPDTCPHCGRALKKGADEEDEE